MIHKIQNKTKQNKKQNKKKKTKKKHLPLLKSRNISSMPLPSFADV
jgi:hypothetical protein